jgi:polyphenol oxidase
MLLRPTIFNHWPGVSAAHSTRHGGVSLPPYQALNLGKKTDDDPAHIVQNRQIFCAALGFTADQMAWSHQVHGTEIYHAATPGGTSGYDALMTNVPGILLCVSVADCTPILVYDTRQQAIAAIHAGWRGTVGGIITRTLEAMQTAFGTAGTDCIASIGPCISAEYFEVGPEVAEQFDTVFVHPGQWPGKYLVDLKAANAAQLRKAGLPEHHIEISPQCTIRDAADFFSHRREQGVTGRMNGAIGLL